MDCWGCNWRFGGLVRWDEQRSAAKSANKQREKQAKQAFERQLKEYEIAWGQELTKYAWDTAPRLKLSVLSIVRRKLSTSNGWDG